MRINIVLCFLFLAWMSSVQAYPWMFFRQDKQPLSVKLDTHVSYFFKNKATVFSGIDLDYHHSTIDINLGYRYSFLEQKHYLRMSELSLVFPLVDEKWKMSLGFRDVLWSEADRYWNYGLWQPRYMMDVFRPVQTGIPGVYLNYKGDTSFTLLLSYFYLPDIIVYPELKEKQITSNNPFFLNVFQKFQWNIDKLDLFQLERFLKPIIAFQVRHFIKDSNVSLSYAYKPINQFQYSINLQENNLSSDNKNPFVVNDFKYSVLSHHLASLEGEIVLAKNLSLFASLFYEKPEKKQQEQKWFTDDFESHLTSSLLLYFQENKGEESNTLFTLGWTKTMENRSQEEISNTVTEDLESVFSRSFLWKEALSASIEYQNKILFHGFLLRLRVNYALDNGIYALSYENYFHLTPNVQMYFSGDHLFSNKVSLKSNTSSISKYKDLSRLVVGGRYVF